MDSEEDRDFSRKNNNMDSEEEWDFSRDDPFIFGVKYDSDEDQYEDQSDSSSDSESGSTFGDYLCLEDLSEKEVVINKAEEYIEYLKGKFVYKHRKMVNAEKLPDNVWEQVIRILRETSTDIKYCVARYNLVDHVSVDASEIRVKDCISLFQKSKSFVSICSLNLYKFEYRSIYKCKMEISTDHLEICQNLCVRDMFQYISFAPIVYEYDLSLQNYFADGFIEMLRTLPSKESKIPKGIKKLTVYTDFFLFGIECNWREYYFCARKILEYRGLWDVYKKYLPIPYLVSVANALRDVGFPEPAISFIDKYLYRTWYIKKRYRFGQF